ncbi:MAG: lysoplasmalogenase [Deltaproteobacteria bacterium]|nr:lysoplasmalogenase [Deltaproteobacteria bacterium]
MGLPAVIAACVAVCVLACAALVHAEWAQRPTLRIGAKLTASAAFVVLGTRGVATTEFGSWIFAGLVCGAIGDAALLGRGSRAFLAGLGAFLAGHLLYVVAIVAVVPPADWLRLAGAPAIAPVAVGLAALAMLWPRLGEMKGPVIVYVGAICAMVIGALAIARGGVLGEPRGCVFAVGATLFFVSDLAVARDRFGTRAFANRAWGLPAYYAGQLLIAWAACP